MGQSDHDNSAGFIDHAKISGNPEKLIPNEDIIEINSIELNITGGVREGESIGFDVITQSDNSISIVVPKKETELIKCLQVGNRINEIMCYSPIAIFSGFGIVVSNIIIKSGPDKGDSGITLRLKVE